MSESGNGLLGYFILSAESIGFFDPLPDMESYLETFLGMTVWGARCYWYLKRGDQGCR